MEHINGFKAAAAALCAALTALWGWFGWVVVAWVVFMVIDYVTGSCAALRAGEWSSKSARDGIWHKLGSIVAVIVAALLDVVISRLLANVPGVELPFTYSVLLSPLVVIWYILTEAGSIIENAGALGAPIPAWLTKMIAVLESKVDEGPPGGPPARQPTLPPRRPSSKRPAPAWPGPSPWPRSRRCGWIPARRPTVSRAGRRSGWPAGI